jgi:hypothetical protein
MILKDSEYQHLIRELKGYEKKCFLDATHLIWTLNTSQIREDLKIKILELLKANQLQSDPVN